MKIDICSSEQGGSATTFTSAQEKIRHLVINLPSRDYELMSSRHGKIFDEYDDVHFENAFKSYTFNFHTIVNDEYDEHFLVSLTEETECEKGQLSRLRFMMHERGELTILFIANELLDSQSAVVESNRCRCANEIEERRNIILSPS